MLNASTNPGHDGYRHGISEGSVAWSIGSHAIAPRDQRVVVWEALQALAFHGRKPADCGAYDGAVVSPATVVGVQCRACVMATNARLTGLERDPMLRASLEREHRIAILAKPGAIRTNAARRRSFADLQKRDRDQRRPTSRAILGGVEAIGAERVRYKEALAAFVITIWIRTDRGSNLGNATGSFSSDRVSNFTINAESGTITSRTSRRLATSIKAVWAYAVSDVANAVAAGPWVRADGFGDQSSVAIEVGSETAAASSARSKASGSSFPLFSARRRMPAQAFAERKNLRGTSPVSKTSDNEHTLPSLGQSPVLSVANPVGPPIPEL